MSFGYFYPLIIDIWNDCRVTGCPETAHANPNINEPLFYEHFLLSMRICNLPCISHVALVLPQGFLPRNLYYFIINIAYPWKLLLSLHSYSALTDLSFALQFIRNQMKVGYGFQILLHKVNPGLVGSWSQTSRIKILAPTC